MTSLRVQVKNLQKRKPRDIDPEDDTPINGDDSSEDEEQHELDGREHYETVEKSRLRKPEQPQLGKNYGGTAISRSALEEQDGEDPFAPVEEDEDEDPFARGGSSTDGSEESDIDTGLDEDFEKYGEAEDVPQQISRLSTRKKHREADDTVQFDAEPDYGESDSSESGYDSDSDVDIGLETKGDESVSDASSASSVSSPGPVTGRRELHQLLKQDTARVAAGLSSQDDVKQGKAVKEQRATYDRLLDARIKLQKGLAASNNLPSDAITDPDAKDAIAKAEAAALSLWSTIDSLRCKLLSSSRPAESAKKRKRPLKPTSTTPLPDLWAHTQSLDTQSVPHRRNTLNHWSTRTRASAPSQPRSRFSSNQEPALSDVLEEYLRKEMQKVTAADTTSPSQAENPTPEQPQPSSSIHFSDDAFYQSLLRDLIASRTSNPLITNSNPALASSTNNLSASGKPPPINNQRNRRNVDTKASKGRKLRYTVHEKIVSFMAPEDRSTWTDEARTEFFGSLFGGQGGLGGGGGHDDPKDVFMGGITTGANGGREEGALRFFRN